MATTKAFLSENTNNIVDFIVNLHIHMALVIIIFTSSSYFMFTTLRIFMALMAGIY